MPKVDNDNQASRGSYDGIGNQAELKRKDSGELAKSHITSGSAGMSVLSVKKRDKSNIMNNLARIHAQRLEDQNTVKEEDEGIEDDERKNVNWKTKIEKLRQGKKFKQVKIPGERMEERIKKRKDKQVELDEWGVKSVPRKQNLEARKVAYRFKNKPENQRDKEHMQVNIEMLHTDELMAYYRELIMKGNRDFTEHQRFQNQLKKLEYQYTICTSKSPNRRSLSPSKSGDQIIDRYIREHSPQSNTKRENFKSSMVSLAEQIQSPDLAAKKKKKRKPEAVVMRQTKCF